MIGRGGGGGGIGLGVVPQRRNDSVLKVHRGGDSGAEGEVDDLKPKTKKMGTEGQE